MKEKKEAFPSKFKTPEESSGFLLWQVSHFWQREQKKALSPLRLTHVQFVLLAGLSWLSKKEKQVTQILLASHSGTDPMMTSQVVRVLETKGLLKRMSHEKDLRKVLLLITSKGEKLLTEAIQVVEEVDHQFFGHLGSNKKTFNKFLQKLNREK